VEMTVVFADLSSFTEMTGRLGATTTYSVVDEFLRLASTTLVSHGALIDKYIGDAVMALFNVPIKRADHAAAAVAAAAQLQQLLPELSERLGMPLQASIGIASGFARVGRLGSDDIKDYTAIGDVVNQAARLQSRQRFFNLTVTNVPGPQFPLYMLGRKLNAFYPMVPVVLNTALGIAIMSYDGKIFFGLLGDYDAMEDLDAFAADLQSALNELSSAAGVPPNGGRRSGRARPASRRTKSRA